MKSRFLRRAGAFLPALALACSLLTIPAAAEDPPDVTNVPLESISLDHPPASMTAGDTEQLTVTFTPANASNKNVTWESSNEDAATVSDSGLVTAQNVTSAASATITATSEDGGKTASCTIAVNPAPPPAVTIEIDPNTASVHAGETVKLSAVVKNAPAATVTWKCSDTRIQLSSRVGLEIAVTVPKDFPAKTHFNVEAQVKDTVVSNVCVVYVSEPRAPEVQDVLISSPNTTAYQYVDPNAFFILEAAAYPLEAAKEDREIVWTSSDTSVAKVNSNGKVTGLAPGKAVIRAAAAGDATKYAEREIEVSGLKLSYVKKSETGGQGTTEQLTESSVVELFQHRDIQVLTEVFGNARNQAINWESSNNAIAQVISGRVTASYPGTGAVIKASVAGTGFMSSFKVNVKEDVAQAITVNMGTAPSYSFSGLLSELNKRSQEKAGGPLDTVYSLKVSTKNGVLHYKYASEQNPGHGVGGTDRFFYQAGPGQMALRDVTFVPLPGFDGTAVVDYNAEAVNGTTFSGTIRIQATASGDVNYSTAADQSLGFAAEHFSDVCKGRTGQSIRYVTFTQPSSSRGTLYYNYDPSGQYAPKVNSTTRYFVSSSPSINDLTFVPAKGYVGDVEVPYRCTDSTGTTFSGTVHIRVYGANGQGGGSVEYSLGRNQRRALNGGDFNDACQRAAGGTLNYIRFTRLPSSSAGTLYLDYNTSSSAKVAADRNYYRNASPWISDITFVPASNYSGTVTVPFIGTTTSGTTFSGDLILHVDEGAGTVHYNTPKGQAVTFGSGDFGDAGRAVTGRTLDHIRFTSLPSSGAGVLYYNYYNSSSYRVSTGTDYYRNSSPSISSLTFVPASGYAGTVSIPFTGYDEDNVRFNGTVTISVGGESGQIISYTAAAGGFVRFSASDFNSACRSATGDALSYVRFDLPSSYYGTLYHQYNSASRTGNAVSSSTGYYYSGSSRLVGDVSFAAAAPGTASFGFTGYNTRGDSFTGTVEISISGSAPAASSVIRYTGSAAHPIPFRGADFQNACQAALGNPLSYVQFNTLPYTGRLYLSYSGPARPGSSVNTTAHYNAAQLSQISYLPKAEYQGTVTAAYTAYDAQGGSWSGTVELQLSNGYCAATFADTASGWDWAKPSIEFLRSSGITNGYGNNTYRPGQSISRGEFTLMICRAFQFPTSGSSGFPDVPAGSTYAGAVASARDLGIVQGNNGRFQPDRPITRQSAMTMICRAIEAAGQSLPAADAGLLSSYADGAQVSAYARPSVAALVQMGAVRGNSASRLNPGAAISRAEMAVILHRVLTR